MPRNDLFPAHKKVRLFSQKISWGPQQLNLLSQYFRAKIQLNNKSRVSGTRTAPFISSFQNLYLHIDLSLLPSARIFEWQLLVDNANTLVWIKCETRGSLFQRCPVMCETRWTSTTTTIAQINKQMIEISFDSNC